MNLDVKLFAVLRQRAGAETVEISLPAEATVADAISRLRADPRIGDLVAELPARMAVNFEYAGPETPISEGDILALVPPVSGGAAQPAAHVRITREPLDPERLRRMVDRPGAGAIVTFTGTPRDVPELDYEAYAEMAERRVLAILTEVIAEQELQAAAAEHRFGPVPAGEAAVVVAAAAAHRAEAFDGCRTAIDRIKAEAPIWKTEPVEDMR